jgi:hypothetical protein
MYDFVYRQISHKEVICTGEIITYMIGENRRASPVRSLDFSLSSSRKRPKPMIQPLQRIDPVE